MKKISGKVPQKSAVSQHCIEAHYISELFERVPESVTIKNVSWEVGHGQKYLRVSINTELTRLGVNYMRALQATSQVEGMFSHISRKEMLRRITAICKKTGHNIAKVRVKSCLLEFEDCVATFKRIQKEMRPDVDNRQKVKVLALGKYTGNVSKLLAKVSSKEFICNIDYVTIRTVVCSKK